MPSLPDFEATGDLSVGVYQATLSEVLARFAVGLQQRQAVGERLVAKMGSDPFSRFKVQGQDFEFLVDTGSAYTAPPSSLSE